MAATDVTRGSVRGDQDGSSVRRVVRRLATETKQAFNTTEFWYTDEPGDTRHKGN